MAISNHFKIESSMNKCSVNCTEPKTKYCLLSIICFLYYAEKLNHKNYMDVLGKNLIINMNVSENCAQPIDLCSRIVSAFSGTVYTIIMVYFTCRIGELSLTAACQYKQKSGLLVDKIKKVHPYRKITGVSD